MASEPSFLAEQSCNSLFERRGGILESVGCEQRFSLGAWENHWWATLRVKNNSRNSNYSHCVNIQKPRGFDGRLSSGDWRLPSFRGRVRFQSCSQFREVELRIVGEFRQAPMAAEPDCGSRMVDRVDWSHGSEFPAGNNARVREGANGIPLDGIRGVLPEAAGGWISIAPRQREEMRGGEQACQRQQGYRVHDCLKT